VRTLPAGDAGVWYLEKVFLEIYLVIFYLVQAVDHC